MPKQPAVFIASPTPGTVKTAYMKSVMATMDDLASCGIAAGFQTEDGSDIVRQRNLLASRFLQEASYTHLLFVDSDMAFQRTLCRHLLAAEKPIVGTVCARKRVATERVQGAIDRGASLADAALFGSDWIVYLTDQNSVAVTDGLLRAAAIGFGVVLIARSVLETMISKRCVVQQPNTSDIPGAVFNFFGARELGQHIPEDLSFSLRWTKDCDGEIWVYTNEPVFHIGDYAYGGSYFRFLEAVVALKEKT